MRNNFKYISKYLHLLLICIFISCSIQAQDAGLRIENSSGAVYLNIGSNAKLNISSPGNTGGIRLENGGSIDNSGSIQLAAGAWINNGNGLVNGSTGNVQMDNSINQPVQGSVPTVFYDLLVNNAAGVSLDKDVVVTHALVLTNGNLAIGAHTLTVNGAVTGPGAITGSAASSLVIGGTAGTLNFTNGSRILKNLTLNNGASATLGTALDITAGTLAGAVTVNAGATLTTGGNLTLRSDANGTARVGNSAGTISGDVAVERFIPTHRAWTFVTAPLRSTGSIWSNWQNNGVPSSTRGVNIWGPTGTNPVPAANGLNLGPNYSMKSYNAATNTWSNNITNTKTTNLSNAAGGTLADNKAFLLFVTNPYDGNGTNITPPNAVSTTLSAKGSLQQGNLSFNIGTTNYTAIGNPYASPVDFSSLISSNGNGVVIQDRFWVYDANIAPYGGYKLVFRNGPDYTLLPDNIPAGNLLHLQSGQAVFVEPAAGGSLTFSEANKSVPGSAPPVFITNTTPGQQFYMSLYKDTQLLDACLAFFDNSYSSSLVPAEDIKKSYNDGVNIAIDKGADGYIVEGRPEITNKDTTFLWFWNAQANQTYHFSFKASQFSPLVSAWLEDAFTGGKTVISMDGSLTDIAFSTTTDAASRALRRFRIVYKSTGATLPVTFTSVKATAQGSAVTVQWKVSNQMNIERYEVERSADGVNYTKMNTQAAVGTNGGDASYNWLDKDPFTGSLQQPADNFYRIRSIGGGNDIKLSQVVNVKMANGSQSLTIYPNPVTNNTINLQLTGMPAGNYQLRLLNSAGQLLFTQLLVHTAVNGTHTIKPGNALARGNYFLEITGPGGWKMTKVLSAGE